MRFIYLMLVLLVLLIIVSFKAHATPIIKYVYDGDTVKIIDGSKVYKLRIKHIDAPEKNQKFGKKSRRALIKLCKNKNIIVNITGVDRYNRKLGNLYCNDQDVSAYMIKNGYAWFNNRFSKETKLAKLEEIARKNKQGLWQANKPTPPWVWRHVIKHQY